MPESRCNGCGRSFTGMSAFDKHQKPTDTRPHSVCLNPVDIGLVPKVRHRDGVGRIVWGMAGTFDWKKED